MKYSNIFFQWEPDGFSHRYSTAVSLHSHTLHSEESLSFIYRLAGRVPPIRSLLRRGEQTYRRRHGSELDLSRAWWTPPLTAFDAWKLERDQIESWLGMNALVSLSDHDDIEGPIGLQLIEESRGAPISVEWTVPFGGTVPHVGVHNLPPQRARELLAAMIDCTENPLESRIHEVLASLHELRETLIVLNHPCWDEQGIGESAHRAVIAAFLGRYSGFIDALEFNGMRPWRENRLVLTMGSVLRLPVISGGDRHAMEPNAVLNLTNASDFAEFVEELRERRWSDLLIMSQYRRNFAWRMIESIADAVGRHEDHGLGWKEWSDRVFYRFDDGRVNSLKQLWSNGAPPAIRLFVGAMGLVDAPQMRDAVRAFAGREEVTL